MDGIHVLLFLIFMHFLSDFVFQPRFLAENKGKSWFLMVVHCIIYTGSIYGVFYFVGQAFLWMIPVIYITHHIEDKWKCWMIEKHGIKMWYLYFDQTFHVVVIILLYFGSISI